MTFKQKQLITVLKNKGLKENIDFRVVHFNDRVEIKIKDKNKGFTLKR